MNKKQTEKEKEHHATSTRPDVAALPSNLPSTGWCSDKKQIVFLIFKNRRNNPTNNKLKDNKILG